MPFPTHYGNAGIYGSRDSPADGDNATLRSQHLEKLIEEEENGEKSLMYV